MKRVPPERIKDGNEPATPHLSDQRLLLGRCSSVTSITDLFSGRERKWCIWECIARQAVGALDLQQLPSRRLAPLFLLAARHHSTLPARCLREHDEQRDEWPGDDGSDYGEHCGFHRKPPPGFRARMRVAQFAEASHLGSVAGMPGVAGG
jgi:hypothetical protein